MSSRNIGIFAHVDAGKTTLSEQLLVHSGRLRRAGSVDRGTAFTDDLPVERRRGISVRATCVAFSWRDVDVRLIDTPGHTDFSAEIERSFWALDAAVLVVDALAGVQPQTEALFAALSRQRLPLIIFINKMDRTGADREAALDSVKRRLTRDAVPLWDPERMTDAVCSLNDDLAERYLNGEEIKEAELTDVLRELTRACRAFPVLSGSALKDQGITELLDAVVTYLPGPDTAREQLCGVAFAAAQDPVMGRGLYVRLFGGKLENRMPLTVSVREDRLTGEPVAVEQKISQIRSADGRDAGALFAGEIGVVYGLTGASVGHVFGDESLLPRKVRPGSFRTPLITVRAIPAEPGQMSALREAAMALSHEDPLLSARYERTTDQLQLEVMGKVQLEILTEIFSTRFGLDVTFTEPRVIYRETVRDAAVGFAAYTMPKPCWAILEFRLEPGPRGSGVTFTSVVPGRDIMPRYQHQVRQALPTALSQGRLGWQVTDIRVTLTGGSHHLIHTHPLDFIVATPMAIQDGLRRAGSVLLEPILRARFVIPAGLVGRIMSDVNQMRGEIVDTAEADGVVTLTALVPAATSLDYPTAFASATGGRGSMSAELEGYRECPAGLGATAPRRGVDPLDTAKYILATRSALEGDIY